MATWISMAMLLITIRCCHVRQRLNELLYWVHIQHDCYCNWYLLLAADLAKTGPLFTKRTYVLPQDFRAARIWQASQQPHCRNACHISKRYDHYNIRSRGFEASWGFAVRRLAAYRIEAQVGYSLNSFHLIEVADASVLEIKRSNCLL